MQTVTQSTLPQYLTHQALAPSARLLVESPTIIRWQTDNDSPVEEDTLTYKCVAELFAYATPDKYFRSRQIHKAFGAQWYHLQPTFEPDNKPRPYFITEVTDEGVRANRTRIQRELATRKEAANYRSMMAESIKDGRKYHIKALDQRTLVTCPITGICFEVQMPSIPVFLQTNHPLANTGNVLRTCEFFLETSENKERMFELDTPVLAGMLLVLLRFKKVLVEQETSALAQNVLLQHIPKGTLCHYIKSIWKGREQYKVWQGMPRLRLNAEGQIVLATLEAWFSKLNLHFAGQQVTSDESAKLFESTRQKSAAQRTLKVYSAEVTQHKKVTANKETAHSLYKLLATSMNPVLRSYTRKAITNLIVITAEQKETISEGIAKAFLGHRLQEKAKQLIEVINSTNTEHISRELDRVSDLFGDASVTTTTKRSMAEILASKALALSSKS